MPRKSLLLAAAAVLGFAGAAFCADGIVANLLRPDAKREVEKLRAAPPDQKKDAQKRLAQIASIQGNFVSWQRRAQNDPSRAREDFAKAGNRDGLVAQMRTVVPDNAVDQLLSDLEPVSYGDDSDWADAVDGFYACVDHPKTCKVTKT